MRIIVEEHSIAMEVLPITIFLAVLISGAHPNPTPESCSVTEDDLLSIKSAIQKASRGPLEEVLPEETLFKCPMLRTITNSLEAVAREIHDMKDSGISTDQVEQLTQSFEQKVSEIVKSRDIFEKQAGGDATKAQGQMIDRMTALQVQVTELQRQIAEQTRRMYETMAELIFERLQMNSTEMIRDYTAIIIEQKLDELMTKLEQNYRIYLGALRYLNSLNDQNLIDKVFDGILKRLEGMKLDSDKDRENGKYVLVNLLCWTVNNDFLSRKYLAQRHELFKIALKFYPNTTNKAANEADVRSRQYCDANFPANVITWFAVSWAGLPVSMN